MYDELEQFYKENYNELCKRAVARSRKQLDGEDVVQETFTRALTFWDAKREIQSLGGWLNTIMINVIRDMYNKEQPVSRTVEYDEFLDEPCEMHHEEEEICKGIVALIEGKPQEVKDILYLYFVREYKPRDIEKIVDAKGPAIRKIIQRFKEEIKEEE